MSRVARTASSFKKCRRRLFSLSLSLLKNTLRVLLLLLSVMMRETVGGGGGGGGVC
jgi:hypothetical protein